MPDNEPAEDRSVRGNAIKPAKVEPEQPIDSKYLVGELGLENTIIKNVTVQPQEQVLVDTGISNRTEVFSVQVVNQSNNSDVIFNGEVSSNMDLSGDKFSLPIEYATVSGDGEDGLNNTFYVLIRNTTSKPQFSEFRINILHFATN